MGYRFTPSNTGKLHLGSARTALISYVMSKKANKPFHLRIEDTDAARSTQEFEDEILDSLDWLGIKVDTEITKQSVNESSGLYGDVTKILIDKGLAYYCQCNIQSLKRLKAAQMRAKKPLGYEGNCRASGHTSGVLRLNIGAVRMFLDPNEFGGGKDIHFTDGVYGARHVDIRDLRDVVLMRSNGTATYLLANTIDDTMIGIHNIVRGADLLPQTAIQILLRQTIVKALSLTDSKLSYTHVPLVLGESGEKLSKRSPTTKSIRDLRYEGIMPNAISQFILGVGNNSVPRDRYVSPDELIDLYDETKNSKNNVAFSEHMLKHINKLHIRESSNTELRRLIDISDCPSEVLEVCKYRSDTINALRYDVKNTMFVLNKFDEQLRVIPQTIEAYKEFRHSKLGDLATLGIPELQKLQGVLDGH